MTGSYRIDYAVLIRPAPVWFQNPVDVDYRSEISVVLIASDCT